MPLLAAIAAAAISRISAFTPQNCGNTAWALYTFSVEDAPLLAAISSEFIKRCDEFNIQALGWLGDFNLDCRDLLRERLRRGVDEIFNMFPVTVEGWRQSMDADDFPRFLRGLGADNLGSVGSRMLLSRMGCAEAPMDFYERATYYVDLHTEEERRKRDDPATWKFGGPTLHKRVFCYAEFRIYSAALVDGEVLEGAIFQENSARRARMGAAPRWFEAVQLPINEIVDRSMCTEFLTLTELSLLLHGIGAGPWPSDGSISGDLRMFTTGPPCVSCITVLRQLQCLFPGLHLAMSFGRSQVVR